VRGPYYRSTYALVYPKGRPGPGQEQRRPVCLAARSSKQAEDQDTRQVSRLGVAGQAWDGEGWHSHQNALAGSGSVSEKSSKELAQGKIEPSCRTDRGLLREACEMSSSSSFRSSRNPVKFDYEAMGVRYGEREWKKTVDKLITTGRRSRRSCADYGVPLVDERGEPISWVKGSKPAGCTMRLRYVLFLVWCSIPLAHANDFPTRARVSSCSIAWAKEGAPAESCTSALRDRCDCGKVDYATWVDLSTIANATPIAGERGGVMRDMKDGRKLIATYRELQENAKKSCFIGTP
jgi:hypothetical protein